MEFRKLGNTEEKISVFGFGTWPLAGMMGEVDTASRVGLIREAIDRGLTFIDTAQMYGNTEELLGEALADGYREKCFLATKVSSDFSAEGVKRAVEHSLKSMKTDRIDLYQLHFYDPDVPLSETLGAIERYREQGIIRLVGVSNFTVSRLQEALSIMDVVSNQINFNTLNRSPEKKMTAFCKKENISVLAHSSLAKGLLSGTYRPGHRFPPDDERSGFPGYSGDLLSRYLAVVDELKDLAGDSGLTVGQAALVWLLTKDAVSTVLVGPKNGSQLAEVADTLDLLEPEGRQRLRREMDGVLDRHDLPHLCPFPNQLV